MDIPELKKLLGRIKAKDQEALKELHALLQQAIGRVKAEDKRAEEILEFYLADKIEFLLRGNPYISPADRADLKQDALVAIFTNIKNGKFDAALGGSGRLCVQHRPQPHQGLAQENSGKIHGRS
jgi:hypothetical protein